MKKFTGGYLASVNFFYILFRFFVTLNFCHVLCCKNTDFYLLFQVSFQLRLIKVLSTKMEPKLKVG